MFAVLSFFGKQKVPVFVTEHFSTNSQASGLDINVISV